MISLGVGVFFGNWIYRGYVKKFLLEKNCKFRLKNILLEYILNFGEYIIILVVLLFKQGIRYE